MGLLHGLRAVNHALIGEAMLKRWDPRHSEGRGRTAACQVAADSIRQGGKARCILRRLASIACHIEHLDDLNKKVHARVVLPDHYALPNNRSRHGGHAHHFGGTDAE